MLGQALVQERIIRIQQLEQAAVLPQNGLKEQLRLPLEGAAQALVELGKFVGIGQDLREIANVQPLPREVAHQRFRARIVKHPAHLLLEDSRILQLALLGQVEQLVVGNTAPQEEGKPRS